MVVVGDNLELDLVCPVAQGRVGVLLRTEYTPSYEIALAESHERMRLVGSLREGVDVLDELGVVSS